MRRKSSEIRITRKLPTDFKVSLDIAILDYLCLNICLLFTPRFLLSILVQKERILKLQFFRNCQGKVRKFKFGIMVTFKALNMRTKFENSKFKRMKSEENALKTIKIFNCCETIEFILKIISVFIISSIESICKSKNILKLSFLCNCLGQKLEI